MFSFQKDAFFKSIMECHPIEKTVCEVPRYTVSGSLLLDSEAGPALACSFSSGSAPHRTVDLVPGGFLDWAELDLAPVDDCSEVSAPNGPVTPESVGLTGSWLLRLKNGAFNDFSLLFQHQMGAWFVRLNQNQFVNRVAEIRNEISILFF